MEIRNLEIEARTVKGSAESRRARRAGKVPAIVYGLGRDPHSCLIDSHTFERELQAGNRTFMLAAGGKTEAALLQDIQYDALGIDIVHIDFKRIDLKAKVTVLIPLNFVGHPEITAGAVLDHVSSDVHVECLPTNIPKSIDVSVAGLKINEHLEAKDIKMPEGVTLADEPNKTIASYHYKHVEVEAAAPGEPGAAPAEPVVLTERKPAEGEAAEKGEKGEKAEKPEKKEKAEKPDKK
jgi:large subunit ribosomal protein L25